VTGSSTGAAVIGSSVPGLGVVGVSDGSPDDASFSLT
jgi:hypothetical protein